MTVLAPPGFTWSQMRADIIRVRFDAESRLIRYEDSAVFHQRAIVDYKAFPGLHRVADDMSPGRVIGFSIQAPDAELVPLEIAHGCGAVRRGDSSERTR